MKLYSSNPSQKTFLKQVENISYNQHKKFQQKLYNLAQNNPNSYRAKFAIKATNAISFLNTAATVYGFKKPSQDQNKS